MNAQELATCADNGIPVKVFIMNNGYLGMVRQWQELFWDRRYSQVEMGGNPDFVKLAEAYGCTGMRLDDKATLRRRDARGARDDGPGRRRRPRHRGGERVPDDRAGRRRARHGGLSGGRAGHQGDCCPSRSSRPPAACTPAASTSSRSSSRTSRAS